MARLAHRQAGISKSAEEHACGIDSLGGSGYENWRGASRPSHVAMLAQNSVQAAASQAWHERARDSPAGTVCENQVLSWGRRSEMVAGGGGKARLSEQ